MIITRDTHGITGMMNDLKIMDDNESKTLDKQESTNAIRGLRIT